MSKELKALKALEKLVDRLAIKKYDENGNLIYWQSTTDNEYTIIKTTLKDYEHSQQQRELYFKQAKELKECYKNELKNTAYYNNLALKYKKALEIIKEKGNFLCLDYSEYENKYYIYDAELYMHNEITKEEYELLKEFLE